MWGDDEGGNLVQYPLERRGDHAGALRRLERGIIQDIEDSRWQVDAVSPPKLNE